MIDVHKIDKIDFSKMSPEIIVSKILEAGDLQSYLNATTTPEYLHWETVKYKPHPKNMSAEEFWTVVKYFRRVDPNKTITLVKSESGETFTWQQLPVLPQFLHEVDLQLGGTLATSTLTDSKETRRYIARGIMEEAIASSQLEGANTTRKAAKQMILEKRAPKNSSDQMILNNYEAMTAIEDSLKDRELTLELLLEMHAMLTKGTIDQGDAGRLRRDSDKIVVVNAVKGVIYHVPPKEKFMRREIDRFVDYANDKTAERGFVHPVIKAITIHFWLGYLHPFVDGNGRLARSLFYWYLLKKEYWAFSFLPLSRVIKNSPIQYRDAYVYSEQDDSDLTYFIDYNVRKIIQAKKEFDVYVKRKQSESLAVSGIAKKTFHFNERQIQLLRYLYKNSGASTTIGTHAKIYQVGRLTARRDLIDLKAKGFLRSTRSGREVPYFATPKIESLFRSAK